MALALLAAGALLIVVFSFLGGPLGAVGFAVVAAAYPFVLMALGAGSPEPPEPPGFAGSRDRRTSGAGRGAAVAIGLLLAMVELSLVGMLALRGRVLDGPWVLGLPLAAALQIYGVFLLPLGVTALGFAVGFRRFGVGEAGLARLRELAPEEPGPEESG